MVEGGVVAPPLPHAVQSLEDATHHAPARVGIVVRAGKGAGRLEQLHEWRRKGLD
jgi:hypothetical protein